MNTTQEKIIIFDYFRTLYNPEQAILYDGVDELLNELYSRKYKLYLVSRLEGQRLAEIQKLGIDKYFKEIYLVTDKREQIHKIRELHPKAHIWVVGDRMNEEIMYGMEIGAKTVWLQKGKFKDEYDFSKRKPDYVIGDITQTLEILNS